MKHDDRCEWRLESPQPACRCSVRIYLASCTPDEIRTYEERPR